ncbi:hypothetical protein N44_03508 [Microcystis aeruginosa NIES-44]|jgi:hypothetical protein|uniref:Uncharacterized protein n=1 Tax=Microcystis aeruginosa NIES-44 TaxID=449439 RepID=A0A0A1VWU0_MICAE|nr:hypothetical protein N44_03508 [Microcystis aeruginosa NIES-44]
MILLKTYHHLCKYSMNIIAESIAKLRQLNQVKVQENWRYN